MVQPSVQEWGFFKFPGFEGGLGQAGVLLPSLSLSVRPSQVLPGQRRRAAHHLRSHSGRQHRELRQRGAGAIVRSVS